MRYRAVNDLYGYVFETDDYDAKEVANKLHLKHLVRDMILCNITVPMTVYDENNTFIRVITQDSFPPIECLV